MVPGGRDPSVVRQGGRPCGAKRGLWRRLLYVAVFLVLVPNAAASGMQGASTPVPAQVMRQLIRTLDEASAALRRFSQLVQKAAEAERTAAAARRLAYEALQEAKLRGPAGTKGPAGARGPTGPTGPTGPVGPPGPAATIVVTNSTTVQRVSPATPITVTARCAPGKAILGGGGRATTKQAIFLQGSYPVVATPNGWTVSYAPPSSLTAPVTVTAFAICSR